MTRPLRESLLRASLVSAGGTGLSRVLGAVRDVAIGHVFGAGRESDAFWMAWTVPSLFRRFVADEGLTGALIPGVAKAEREEGPDAAHRLADGALLALLLVGFAICALGILGAPALVGLIAPGFAASPGKFELTVRLTRGLFPFVVFVSLVSYCEGLLNYRRHFFVPKIAPGIVSACIAAASLWLSGVLREPIFAVVVGALAGGLTHLLVCIPPLVRRWRLPRPSLRGMQGARFRAFSGEMAKVVAIGLVAQLNVVLLRVLASYLEEGSMTHYWYANRLVDLTQGTIAVAVSSALLPAVARDAADGDWTAFRENLVEAIRLAGLVLIPAAFLLLVLARPLVSLLFIHGRFGAEAAGLTAATLQALTPFMVALGAINIVKKAFFALDDRTTLLWVGMLGLVTTSTAGLLLSSRLGVAGLGWALSISSLIQLIAYLVLLRWRLHGSLGLSQVVTPLLKLAAASAPAALAAMVISRLGDWSQGPAQWTNGVVLAAAALAGASAYFAGGWMLDVTELRAVPPWIAARLGRGS